MTCHIFSYLCPDDRAVLRAIIAKDEPFVHGKSMAQTKVYRCVKCGYEAEIYEGKGFMGQHIVTMSCPDCRTLQPLVVGGVIGDVAPSFRSEVGRLCLRCGSERIVRWNGHSCPQCGADMTPTGDVTFWT